MWLAGVLVLSAARIRCGDRRSLLGSDRCCHWPFVCRQTAPIRRIFVLWLLASVSRPLAAGRSRICGIRASFALKIRAADIICQRVGALHD